MNVFMLVRFNDGLRKFNFYLLCIAGRAYQSIQTVSATSFGKEPALHGRLSQIITG